MTDILDLVDVDRLRTEIQSKYREVAEDPATSFHFHTGRQHALRLGYAPTPLDQLPEEACEAFAGVAHPYTFAGTSGEESARRFGTYGYPIRARRPG